MNSKLTLLEKLHQEAADQRINLVEYPLPERTKALHYAAEDVPPVIMINQSIYDCKEETCVLAEELGHYCTSSGDILLNDNVDAISVQRQENRARRWAAKKLVPLESLILAHEQNIQNRYELAEYLDITEEFLDWALDYYKSHYGLYVNLDETYTIFFDPFIVFKNMDIA